MSNQKSTASVIYLRVPIAPSLSLAKNSIWLAIRIASVMYAFWLGVARIIFICGFRLARGIIQGAISRFARQPASQTRSQSLKDKDNSPQDFGIFLHHGLAASWAYFGFHIRTSRLRTAAFNLNGVISLLDQLYCFLDSTRSLVSAIATIRRRIRESDTHHDSVGGVDTITKGEQMTFMDPIIALAAFAYLQHACQDSEEEITRRRALEETILDVVVRNGTRDDAKIKQEIDAALFPPTSSSIPEDDDAFATRQNSQAEDGLLYQDEGPKAAEGTEDDGREVDSLMDAALEKKRQRKFSTGQDYAKPTASSSRRKEITAKRPNTPRTHTPRSSQDSSRRSRPSSVEMSIDESSLKRIGQAHFSQPDSRSSTGLRAKTAAAPEPSNSRIGGKIKIISQGLPVQADEIHSPDLFVIPDRETSQDAYGDPGSLESEESIGCSASMRSMLIDMARYVQFVFRLNQRILAPGLEVRDQSGCGQCEESARDPADGSCVLLASFEDSLGGKSLSGSTQPRTQVAYSVSLDHDAGAVILACSGTGDTEDALAALAGEVSKLAWQGRIFKVHRGAHSAACRLLCGRNQRVLAALEKALAEFPGYRLVLCGHSFGAGVASILGVLLSEPSATGAGLVTRAWPYSRRHDETGRYSRVPAGRRIHVYAYGPPGVMCASLRRVTRGLITTVVHGADVIPSLSPGLADELRRLGRAWRDDENGMRTTMRQHALGAVRGAMPGVWPFQAQIRELLGSEPEDGRMVPALEAMRLSMRGRDGTLLPPGKVFTLETHAVRGADGVPGLVGQRVVLKQVRRVEDHFQGVRLGRAMLTDHDLAGYKQALAISRRIYG